MRTRIMYIEDKSGGLTGPCRIGRVSFSKSGRSLYYDGRTFQSLTGLGFKANYFDLATGDHYWISGPRRDGADGLYGRITRPEDVDPDIADAYWRDIRGLDLVPCRPATKRVTSPGAKAPAVEASTVSMAAGRKASRIAGLAQSRVEDMLTEAEALREEITAKCGTFSADEIRELRDQGRR